MTESQCTPTESACAFHWSCLRRELDPNRLRKSITRMEHTGV